MGNYTLQQAQNDVAALRGVIAHLLANAEITTLTVDGVLTATSGTAGSPSILSTDTWHDLAPTLTGWSQRGSADPLQYTLLPWPAGGSVWIYGSVTGTALAGGVTIATLPTGYRPSTWSSAAGGVCTTNVSLTTNDIPNVVVGTDGTIQVRGATGATILQFNYIFPLGPNTS